MPDYVLELKKILCEMKQMDDIAADENLLAKGIIDSFDIIILTVRLEQDFGIALDAESITAENFRSVAAMAVLLDRS